MLGQLQHEVTRETSSIHVSDEPQSYVNNWYFSRQELEDHTPSRKDGIEHGEESHIRKLYCSFLQELGMELQVPQMTIATAMMFCHRFYMRQSHAKNCWKTIATASMFLGCKAEETSRRLNDFTVVAYKLIFKWDPSAPRRIKQKEVYDQQKKLIIDGERVLLATLAFDLNIRHPYTPLAAALKRLDISNKELSRVAWNFVNDWLRTTLCLQYKPHYIAAGSIFLAAKILKLKLPKEKGKVWWMQFDVAPKHLEDVVQQMMRLLEHDQKQPKPKQAAQKPVVRKEMSSREQSCSQSGSAVVQDSGILATVMKTDGLNDVVSSKGFENKACSYVQSNLYETTLSPNLISGKTIPSSVQSCTANGIVAPDISPSLVDSGGLNGSVLLKCNKVPTCSDVQNNPKEKALHCQASDSGSVFSVVENCESEPVTGKSDLNACTVSGVVDVLHYAEGLNDCSVLSTRNTKPACGDVQDTLKESLHCQESDSGSAVSVVEDSEGEPITRKSDLKSSYKIVPVEAGSAKIDVNRIRETVKKRRKDRIINQKLVEDTDDVLDGEAWIERELENGIKVESAHSKWSL